VGGGVERVLASVSFESVEDFRFISNVAINCRDITGKTSSLDPQIQILALDATVLPCPSSARRAASEWYDEYMKPKIQVPAGFPTSAEIIRDLHLTKADVQAVERLLDWTISKTATTGKNLRKRSDATGQKKAKSVSSKTALAAKAKSIRQRIARKRSHSNHNS
jgi:hypothetical protein